MRCRSGFLFFIIFSRCPFFVAAREEIPNERAPHEMRTQSMDASDSSPVARNDECGSWRIDIVVFAEPPIVISTEGRNPEAFVHSPASGSPANKQERILRTAPSAGMRSRSTRASRLAPVSRYHLYFCERRKNRRGAITSSFRERLNATGSFSSPVNWS